MRSVGYTTRRADYGRAFGCYERNRQLKIELRERIRNPQAIFAMTNTMWHNRLQNLISGCADEALALFHELGAREEIGRGLWQRASPA